MTRRELLELAAVHDAGMSREAAALFVAALTPVFRAAVHEAFVAGFEAGAGLYTHLLAEDDWPHDAGDVEDAWERWEAER